MPRSDASATNVAPQVPAPDEGLPASAAGAHTLAAAGARTLTAGGGTTERLPRRVTGAATSTPVHGPGAAGGGQRLASPVHRGVGPVRKATRPPGVLAGIVVFLLVAVVGALYVVGQRPTYSASASFALFPRPLDNPAQAGYYETLSRGQIVSTIAQLVKADQPTPPPRVSPLVVSVVDQTSIVQIDVTAPTAMQAEQAADAGLMHAVALVQSLKLPYAATVANTAAGHAQSGGTSKTKLGAIVALVAITLGLAVQQSFLGLRRRSASRRTAGSRPAEDPARSPNG